MMSGRITFLMDNGSLEPAATLRLRELAAALAGAIGERVEPISLLHASAIPAERLGGVAAEIFEPAVARRAAQGRRRFLVVPLFFGPSRALTEYLPGRVGHLRRSAPGLEVRVAAPLFADHDPRLAEIIAEHVKAAGPAGRVALVDHGSPVRAVTEVRNRLAAQLQALLGGDVKVAPASMERRPEAEFAFGEPLLESLLTMPGWNAGEVTVAMQFLLPGRHAGPDGDVAQICRRAEAASRGLRTRMTRLVAEHPRLVDILADRWREAAGY